MIKGTGNEIVSLGTCCLGRIITLVMSLHDTLVFQLSLVLDLIQSRMQIRNDLTTRIRNRIYWWLRRCVCP
jgi:hypothetical protein